MRVARTRFLFLASPTLHQSGPEIDENNSEVDQSWPEIDKNNSEVDRSGPETAKHNSEMHKNASANAITPWQKLRVLLPLNHITGLVRCYLSQSCTGYLRPQSTVSMHFLTDLVRFVLR